MHYRCGEWEPCIHWQKYTASDKGKDKLLPLCVEKETCIDPVQRLVTTEDEGKIRDGFYCKYAIEINLAPMGVKVREC